MGVITGVQFTGDDKRVVKKKIVHWCFCVCVCSCVSDWAWVGGSTDTGGGSKLNHLWTRIRKWAHFVNKTPHSGSVMDNIFRGGNEYSNFPF